MKALCAIAAIALLCSCSTITPPRYAVSVDNHQALQAHTGSRIRIVELAPPAEYRSMCRMAGWIEPTDGMTMEAFICKAFNDELKLAGVYSESGIPITGTLDKIAFSSSEGVDGYWDLAVTLRAPNGKSVSTATHMSFKSGFAAITACQQTAQALVGATQDLIRATVTDPAFRELYAP